MNNNRTPITKRWKIASKVSEDLIEQLLYNRGIKTKEDKERFFNPRLDEYDKELKIPGVLAAIKRINKAIEEQGQIIVYGDYDVDGVCSTAIMYLALNFLGAKVLPYIPHREKEGYGLSKIGLDKVRDLGASLVITVDNGIVACEMAKYAKQLGLDLIITDHHEQGEEKPEVDIVVHTTKMCATGIAWCVVREMVDRKLAEELLQFVAIATICDMLPLIGVNRAFVAEGLKQLNKTQNLGLLSLMDQAGVVLGSIGSYEIGYVLGPRLNAIGRLDHAIDALRLLCTKNPKKARELAKLLADANSERQRLTITGVDGAKLLVAEAKNIYVLDSGEWVPGVIGLIAGRICEEFYKPVIAISVGEEFSKGSARSIDGINIVDLLRKTGDLLVDIGGHSKAAGFTIKTENLDQFKRKIESLVEDIEISDPVILIDAVVDLKEITESLVYKLKDFEPFGLGNSKPILVLKRVRIDDYRTVGDGKHLKIKVNGVDAIAFGFGSLLNMISMSREVDIAFYPEINHYNGVQRLQLNVKDIKLPQNF